MPLYSTFTLASRTTFPHLTDSALMKSANSAGELVIGSYIAGATNFSRKASSANTRRTSALIRATYHVLGLRTFFTFNEKEVRAWTIHAGDTAVRAAGTIHTDFERGFIKAETVNWDDLVKCGSVGHARETGHYRIEGRDYVVKDGDVLLFKFNV